LKKILFYFAFVIILIFSMPIIFTNQFKSKEVVSEQEEIEEEKKFDYGEFNTIRLLHVETGEVENLDLDTYLYGVVSSEMPASFDLEALKAQAVVARTYTIYHIKNDSKHENADVCDSSLCCQAWISKENRLARWEENLREEYWNKIVKAVNETKGKVVLYNGEPINALFHSNSGGRTELSINVWGGDYPYFQTVETSGEQNYTSYSSEVQVSKDELVKKMLEKYSGFKIDFKDPLESYFKDSRVEFSEDDVKSYNDLYAKTTVDSWISNRAGIDELKYGSLLLLREKVLENPELQEISEKLEFIDTEIARCKEKPELKNISEAKVKKDAEEYEELKTISKLLKDFSLQANQRVPYENLPREKKIDYLQGILIAQNRIDHISNDTTKKMLTQIVNRKLELMNNDDTKFITFDGKGNATINETALYQ